MFDGAVFGGERKQSVFYLQFIIGNQDPALSGRIRYVDGRKILGEHEIAGFETGYIGRPEWHMLVSNIPAVVDIV